MLTTTFALSPEQLAVVQGVWTDIQNGKMDIRIGGLAGTGKSTLLFAIYTLLLDRGLSVVTCAPTGKAADVLRKKGLDGAKTIHNVFYQIIDQEKIKKKVRQDDGSFAEMVVGDRPIFMPKIIHNIADVFLGDEMSMCPEETYRHIQASGMICIIFGDHGQLGPVETRGLPLMQNPDYRLETIHRNAGPIAEFAHHLRANGVPLTWSGIEMRKGSETSVSELMQYDQIVCGKNKTRVQTNDTVRKILGRTEMVEPGDRIISLDNNPEIGIFNGTQATVLDVLTKNKYVIEADGRTIEMKIAPGGFGMEVKPKRKPKDHMFDYGYCVTCHKSQGSEWDSVAVIDEAQGIYWNSIADMRRWRYTAASRAKSKLLWVL